MIDEIRSQLIPMFENNDGNGDGLDLEEFVKMTKEASRI